MNEARKRKAIKSYFKWIKRRNQIKKNLEFTIIVVFFVLLILIPSGNLLFIGGYSVFLLIFCFFYFRKSPVPEDKIDRWLEEDKRELIRKAVGKLEIENELFSSEIILWTGISRDFAERRLGDIDIDSDDYFFEAGLDNKKRFGVYSFGAIFLCQAFLAYYKCYWNFIEGASIDDEFSEYLYISIASVKYQEYSSSKEDDIKRVKKPEISKKIKYNLFVITTSDSQRTEFFIREDAEISYVLDPYKYISDRVEPSEAHKAVKIIRDQIRQRRVDYQNVRAIDSDFRI